MITVEKSIPAWKSFMYQEVWKVTQFKDGCVYKTERTGYVVKADSDLGREIDSSIHFKLVNFSTKKISNAINGKLLFDEVTQATLEELM